MIVIRDTVVVEHLMMYEVRSYEMTGATTLRSRASFCYHIYLFRIHDYYTASCSFYPYLFSISSIPTIH
jgi:hypothetical protein